MPGLAPEYKVSTLHSTAHSQHRARILAWVLEKIEFILFHLFYYFATQNKLQVEKKKIINRLINIKFEISIHVARKSPRSQGAYEE